MDNFSIDLSNDRILIIEDSLEYKQLISGALGGSDQHIYVSSLSESYKKLKIQNFDCIILDLHLPDGTGFEFIKKLKKENISTPIVILTATEALASKVIGLSMGAMDYIVKPFDSMELVARIKSKINFTKNVINHANVKNMGNLFIDTSKRKVSLDIGSQMSQLDLTPKEFDILLLFFDKEDIVFSRNQVLDRVWGEANYVLERSVDSTIASLRKKTITWTYKLKSIYGVGYQLVKKEPNLKSLQKNVEVLNIFSSESKKQLEELGQSIYLGEWKISSDIVHKLKGTFSLFSNKLSELANKIDKKNEDGKEIEAHCKEFLTKAHLLRDEILNNQEHKKVS